jgi:hypothetical protein
MIVITLGLAVLVFVLALEALGATKVAAGAVGTARAAVGAMRAQDLPEEEKEARLRRASLSLFGSFARVAAIGAAALAASAAVVLIGAALGLFTLHEALSVAAAWPFLLGSTLLGAGAWATARRLRRSRPAGPAQDAAGVPYRPLDRALHRMAFGALDVQRALADHESRLHAERLDMAHARRPIFITSLPRAGTTVMLETLAALPELASATYRHMPFPLLPLMWGDVSRRFGRAAGAAERAHGDGIEVGFDSPEAFEEPLWMAFWPGHYGPRAIQPWDAGEDRAGFESFFRRHMAKVVAAEGGGARRYVSKNNAGIARIGLLQRIFPDAMLVVPVRDPWAQVASLMRQHARFTRLHAAEPFARRYMEGLGHFEFGEALRPFAFDGASADPSGADAAAFWLELWCGAYERALGEAKERVVFVDHDALSAAPRAYLPALAAALELEDPAALAARVGR